MNNLFLTAAKTTNWDTITPILLKAISDTLYMVSFTMVLGGVIGLIFGLTLYTTRKGNLFECLAINKLLDFIINVIRPIPFIIFLTAIRPVTIFAIGTSIGTQAAIVPMVIICSCATARIVEQNLLSTEIGIIEAAKAMGAGRLYIIFKVLIPEALAPLILGYAFLFVGVCDMSAMAGTIAGGGLGDFALQYGYRQMNDQITLVAIIIIVIIVQIAQQIANILAKKIINRR